jgi:hypothetical protein
MKRLDNRVTDLEARQKPDIGRWHNLIQRADQTQEEALDAYGRHLIGEHDRLIINRTVAPRFNPDGSRLFYSDWPENQG